MKTFREHLLYLAPRVLCVLFALFLSLFALDVFQDGLGFWKTLLALMIHLIPVFLVLAILAIAWRWEWAGAVLLAGLGMYYLVSTRLHMHWTAYALICGPLFVISALFLAGWISRKNRMRKLPENLLDT